MLQQLGFVLCPSFHGATLLALLLNNHSTITALGDTNPTRTYDQTCACGLKVSDCPFWATVARRLNTSRFDNLSSLLPILPAPLQDHHLDGGAIRLSRNAVLNRLAGKGIARMADAVLPIAWRVRSSALAGYVETWQGFYQLVRELHGTSMVVDGGKTPRKPEVLSKALAGRAELRVIHLVRDPRGFVASVRRPDPAADIRTQAWLWSDRHHRIERLASSLPYLRVRYEDLAQDPAEYMTRIFDFLGVPFEPVVSAPMYPQKHHLMGNSMLFHFTGEVGLNERWREELTADEQRAVVRHSAATMERYGYR